LTEINIITKTVIYFHYFYDLFNQNSFLRSTLIQKMVDCICYISKYSQHFLFPQHG